LADDARKRARPHRRAAGEGNTSFPTPSSMPSAGTRMEPWT
jgi:hypothetical protein